MYKKEGIKKMKSTELVKRAMKKQGLKNPNQLANALGGSRTMAYKLVKGDSEPSYETTLKLLNLAGIVPTSLLEMSQKKVTYKEELQSNLYSNNVYYVK